MLLKLVWNKLWFRKLNSLLCILLMAIGVAIISLVASVGSQLEKQFSGNISGIDMVLGAKGSPLQLILAAVFHIDAPTGNIALAEAEQYEHNPMVKTFIPLSFGDNYQGFRIIGTDQRFSEFYKLNSNSGFPGEMKVILGSEVARLSQLKTGDRFQSSHGLDQDGESHEESAYEVIGIAQKTGTVADKLIITSLESVWHIHEHGEENGPKEITAALVKFKSPMGIMTIPRQVNENTTMQAALPPIEINRLFSLFDSAIQVARYLAYLIVLVSGISVFISLYNSLKDQRNEKALMMSMGASRGKIFLMLLLEGIFLSLLGYLLGILLSKITILVLQHVANNAYLEQMNAFAWSGTEIYLLLMALLIGVVSAALPASGVFRINIAQTLARD